MDLDVKTEFLEKWPRYFPGCELPLACFYADRIDGVEFPKSPGFDGKGQTTCLFSQLAPVRKGRPRAFNKENLGCPGAARLFGFIPPSSLEDTARLLVDLERHKKSVEHVIGTWRENPPLEARGKYLVFKPWECLTMADSPEAICFFVTADAVAGLHNLANFDAMDAHGVIVPFGSGCDTLAGFAMKEAGSDAPRAVMGLFDPVARTCVNKALMSFAAPWQKFLSMLENMDACFLDTAVWDGVKTRLEGEV